MREQDLDYLRILTTDYLEYNSDLKALEERAKASLYLLR